MKMHAMPSLNSNKSPASLSSFADIKGLSRDRPWLLPSNRKLRHLQGISLRNLTLSRTPARPRGKTSDDESLPNAFRSPKRLLALRESQALEHSRSSDDLKSVPKSNGFSNEGNADTDTQIQERPLIGKLKRRSTSEWTNSLPRARQKKLEEVTRGRMADTWFSLHDVDILDPLYLSEVVYKAMNPDFRFFDLNTYGPSVNRRDELIVKVWAQTENMEDYILLIELKAHLRSLQFIGKTLESFHHPLPPNCIIFHLADGIYTSFTDLPLDEPVPILLEGLKLPSQISQFTSSSDALLRLSNLDDCIQDALITREKLTTQVNNLLKDQEQEFDIINTATQARESLAATKRAISAVRIALKAAQIRRSGLQSSLEARRAAIKSGSSSKEKSQSAFASVQQQISSYTYLLQVTATEVSGQIRRVCEDLLCIYPLEPTSGKPLLFTVRGLPLPNASSPSSSSLDDDPPATAAALAWVAHITHLLSLYLSTPIPYPPTLHGSTSSILDPISISLHSLAARTFPLYQKGSIPFRFEYGVFLLNTNIELLMRRQGLRMLDKRHTLPNLKYLFYVLTVGKGEVPARKRGDVRGMLGLSSANTRLSLEGQQRGGSDDGMRLESSSSGNGSPIKGKFATAQDNLKSLSSSTRRASEHRSDN